MDLACTIAKFERPGAVIPEDRRRFLAAIAVAPGDLVKIPC